MRLTHLQFAAPAPAMRGWRLLLLCAGALALLAAAWHWRGVAQSGNALEARLLRAQPRVPLPLVRSAEQQRADELQAKAVARAVQLLNLPTEALIRQIQPPPDVRVALLSFEIGNAGAEGASGGGTLKLRAEAASAHDMTTYLAFLDEQALFASVYLLKHEMAGSAAEPQYRFELEATWRK